MVGGMAQWLGRQSFDWQTFPVLIYGWHVTTLWVVSAIGQPTRPTQPLILRGR